MAVDCTSKGMYESLSWCPGQTSTPGIRRKVYFIPKSWIEKWPALPAIDGAESMAALATYEGDFVLAADKKWQYIELLTTKSSISAESQGEVPSKTFLNKATLVHAGTDEEASGFCRQANVDELIFLCQQKNGKFRVLGSEAFDPSVTILKLREKGIPVPQAPLSRHNVQIFARHRSIRVKSKLKMAKFPEQMVVPSFREAN